MRISVSGPAKRIVIPLVIAAGVSAGVQPSVANATPVAAPSAPTITAPSATGGDRTPTPSPSGAQKTPKPAAAFLIPLAGIAVRNAAGYAVRNSPAVLRQLESIYKWKR